LAVAYENMGDVGQALAHYHKSLANTERIGDQHTSANQYLNLGHFYHKQGDVEQARAHYEKAKALYQMVGDVQRAQRAARALRRL